MNPARPLKVLLLSVFHPELVRGGAQQVCHELFEAYQARPDVQPTLLAAIDPTFTSLYKSGAGITGFDGREGEYLFLSRDYDPVWHKTGDIQLINAFVDFLQLVRPDVVHFHHFLLFGIDLISLTRTVLPQARIVFTFHEFMAMCAVDGHLVRTTDQSVCTRATALRCHQCLPEYGPETFFLREAWMKRHLGVADHFTTPTRFMIDILRGWGLPQDRFTHISNGQAHRGSGRVQEPLRPRRNRFGFFGQFVDAKGVHLLLEAVSILRAEGFTDFSVELNGDNIRYASDARRAQIEAFLEAEAALPLGERIVTLNGSYQADQIGARMRRVDWCVMPSVWFEAFGLVISEAWSFGRPVICSDVGAMAERVTHEGDGLAFHMGDARSLAESLRRACLEDGLWDRLSAGIAPQPSSHQMADSYLSLYNRLLFG